MSRSYGDFSDGWVAVLGWGLFFGLGFLFIVIDEDCNGNYSGVCLPERTLISGSLEEVCDGFSCVIAPTGRHEWTDVDCHEIDEKNFKVVGEDEFGLDGDDDGIACEASSLDQSSTPTISPTVEPSKLPPPTKTAAPNPVVGTVPIVWPTMVLPTLDISDFFDESQITVPTLPSLLELIDRVTPTPGR
jgi:hypothetical protein